MSTCHPPRRYGLTVTPIVIYLSGDGVDFWPGVDELLRRPRGGGILRAIDVDNPPMLVGEQPEDERHAPGEGRSVTFSRATAASPAGRLCEEENLVCSAGVGCIRVPIRAVRTEIPVRMRLTHLQNRAGDLIDCLARRSSPLSGLAGPAARRLSPIRRTAMSHRAHVFVLCAAIILSLARPTGQAGATKTLNGFITIKTSTSGGTTAVLGKKDAASKEGEFLFCIDQARTAPQKIEFSGPARVMYRLEPLPPGIPAGIGPESVSNTLAVVPTSGKAWLFVGKGEKPVLPPGDPALANATTVNVTQVIRVDWASGNGPRRGVDLEACLAPGG